MRSSKKSGEPSTVAALMQRSGTRRGESEELVSFRKGDYDMMKLAPLGCVAAIFPLEAVLVFWGVRVANKGTRLPILQAPHTNNS